MKHVLSMLAVIFITICSAYAFAEEADRFRIGVGGGVPYGGIGMNAEYRFNNYVSATAGLGYYTHEAPGVSVGAIVYPLQNNRTVNPRLSGYFGRVSTLERKELSGTTYRALYGGALGVGFDWHIYKKLTFSLDVLGLIKDCPDRYKYAVSVGAGFGFLF